MNIEVQFDEAGLSAISGYYQSIGKKLARAELMPILIDAINPVVSKEKEILSKHIVSGALSSSLKARAGSGDRPGTISVFAAPTATMKTLKATWGQSTKQKRRFHANLAAKGKRGRTAIFYADFLHEGHRLVKKKNGVGRVIKNVDPVPFAAEAMEAVGDQQADTAANAILNHVIEG